MEDRARPFHRAVDSKNTDIRIGRNVPVEADSPPGGEVENFAARRLLEMVPSVVMKIGEDGRAQYVSAASETMHGY